ncbi:hypothetical protein [Pseudomonas sp. W2Aug9]|uniref:hypothetical protein n=1 Tax=Pseudomonas sp. W2Aug9 TaxID=1215242 RepID=UPI0020057917|nr:hypothetical protein [Pseudomonas sp. W2Aug9]MCK3826118.1 hypothetical protein [Pseudomonas sp. W2Aug9]
MNNPNHSNAKLISGTCTAVVEGDEDLKRFEGPPVHFYLDEDLNRWFISALTEPVPFGHHQQIELILPNEGHVIDKTYEIVNEWGAQGKANASWIKRTSHTFRPYTASSGSVKVSLDPAKETVHLTFHFKAQSGTRIVTLTKGDMEVEGTTKRRKANATGSVTCDISDAVNRAYRSMETALTTQPASGSFPAHISVWSREFVPAPDPHPFDYRVVFNFAEGLVPGTYNFSSDNKQVRAFVFDLNQNVAWPSESGTITLTSIPDFETLAGTLSGDFDFAGTVRLADGRELRIKVGNGKLNIEK